MLQLLEHAISDVELGAHSGLSQGRLLVSRAGLEEAVASDRIAGIDLAVARPGDRVRIAGVVDVIEPRTKIGSGQVTFPGVATENIACGSGSTIALRGLAVTTVGEIPSMAETFVQEDSLIDMAGPGSGYSPFAEFVNLVIRVRMSAGTPDEAHMAEVRRVGIEASRYLASIAASADPDSTLRYEDSPSRGTDTDGRVVYVCSLISEGPLHDTLLYGATTEEIRPTWLPVTHMVDGALVSSDLHYSNQRTPTYLYQRNPIVEAIRARSEIELLGVILTLRYGSHEEKQTAAREVADMAAAAGADSLVVHPAVGGNAHVDAVDIVEEAEKAGMSAVLVLQEMAGAAGSDLGLVHFVPEADALVSTGNRDEVVTLPPLDRVLGPVVLKDGSRLDQEVEISLRSFLSSTSQVGAHRMTTVAG